jgi:hypothetical protein
MIKFFNSCNRNKSGNQKPLKKNGALPKPWGKLKHNIMPKYVIEECQVQG